jgi:hypothetical protein
MSRLGYLAPIVVSSFLGCHPSSSTELVAVDAAATVASSATASASAVSAIPKREPYQRLASYPNGGALVADPTTCNVSRVHETVRWTRNVSPCDQTLEVAVALDSTAVVRSPAMLIGYDVDGNETWRLPASQPLPNAPLSGVAVTKDSVVVVAESAQLVVAYRKGKEVWRFVLPASDPIVATPIGNQTEGVLVASARGVRSLGADGSLRWASLGGPPRLGH